MKQPLDKIITFEPKYKSVIWGGSRISALKGEPCGSDRVGESWEISGVSGNETVVNSGPHLGKTITELAETYGEELLGKNSIERYGRQFPLLVKLLDAHDILSLQVHPSDEIALRNHNCHGKTEMWYVISSRPGSKIYTGFSSPMSPEKLDSSVRNLTLMDVVQSYSAEAGQFYYIPAGTLHSIGAGNLIAEIQISSDITYRIYDHNRTDADGLPRQLHIDQAREAIDYAFPNIIEPTARIYPDSTPNAVESEYFTVGYINLSGGDMTIAVDGSSFTVVLVTNGTLTIEADGATRTLTAGHTALIPASVRDLKVSGTGIAITARI